MTGHSTSLILKTALMRGFFAFGGLGSGLLNQAPECRISLHSSWYAKICMKATKTVTRYIPVHYVTNNLVFTIGTGIANYIASALNLFKGHSK